MIYLITHGDPKSVKKSIRRRNDEKMKRGKNLEAVKQNRVVILPPDLFGSNPGTKVTEAMDFMYKKYTRCKEMIRMESSEVVREKEHPFAKKKMDNSSYFSYINNPRSLCTVFFAGSLSFSIRDILTGIQEEGSTVHRIVWDLRIPRVLIGFIVGTCLAASGTLLQGVMRNPLADPGIIGVSSGAGFVAIVIMILFPQHLAFFTTRGVFRSFHNSDGYLCFIMAKRGTTFKDRLSRGVDQCINWCSNVSINVIT